MADLVTELIDQIHVHHGEILLVDRDGANGQPEGGLSPFDLADQAGSSGNWFLTSGNVAYIASGYSFHHCLGRPEGASPGARRRGRSSGTRVPRCVGPWRVEFGA
ncbi:hypothetical protein ACQP1V_02260 [Microtetraspora malaysiensis]|uniref:hypothetical protein n=1 Tax=Microtetraspora malaysiensis TaxID=161358 RepID=UPI003D8A79B7